MNATKRRRGIRAACAGIGAVALAAALVACSSGGGGSAEADEEVSLKGKTVNMVVPYAPGGSYDRLARGIQKGFQDASGATVVVLNEPGAGSLLATNRTFVSPPRENRIQLLNTVGVVAAQLAKDVAEGVNYDLSKFKWIGSFSDEPEVLVAAAGSPLAEPGGVAKALKEGRTLRYGATGPGDNTWIDAFLLRDVLGFKIEIVSGFDGAPDIYSALLRGDIDITMSSLASALTPITAGDGAPILYVGSDMKEFENAHKILSEIPELGEFIKEVGISEDRYETFIEPYSALLKVNRTLVAPPDTSDAQLEAYRAAFDEAINDKKLIASSAEQRLYIVPKQGKDTEAVIKKSLDAPGEFVELLKRSFAKN